MAKKQLNIILGVDVGALERSLKGVERRLQRFASNIQSIGRELTTSVTLPLAALGGAAIKTFAEFDKLEKGLAAVTGSAEEGERQLDSLLNIVKDTQTTLDLQNATKVSLQLQGVGLAASEAERLIRGLGVAATATGQTADDVGEVGRQLSQSLAKGSVFQQELNILFDRLPALSRIVKETFGVVTAEGLRDAGVSAQQFVTQLSAAIEADERLSRVKGGLAKSIESFGIELQIAGKEFGETIANTLNLEANLNKVSGAISKAVNFFKSLNPEIQEFIVKGALFAAAIGPILLLIGKFVALGGSMAGTLELLVKTAGNLGGAFAFLTSPIGLTIAAVVALVAGVVALYNRFEDVRKIINGLVDFFYEFYEILKDLVKPIAQIAKGLFNASQLNFKQAAANLAGAFTGEVPSVTEAGVRLGAAFTKGFNDSSNRLEGVVEGLKNKIFNQTKDIQNEFANATFPTGGGFPSGGSTGGAGSSRRTGITDTSIIDVPVDFIPEDVFRVDELEQQAQRVQAVLDNYRNGLQLATDSAKVFGTEGNDLLQVKLDFTRQALQSAIDQSGQYSEAVKILKSEYVALTEQIAVFNEQQQQQANQLAAVTALVQSTLTPALTGFFTALADGSKNAFGAFVDGFKKAIVELLKRLAIALAQAIAVAIVLSIIFPSSTAGGGSTFGAKLGSLFKQFSGIPGLASGGIVPPGYPNDTFPARLTSGEAVIPLDKLDQMGGGGNVFIPNLTIKGQDFVIAFEKAKASYNRIS